MEERHARFCEERLAQTGGSLPPPAIGLRSRVLSWLVRRLGPEFRSAGHHDIRAAGRTGVLGRVRHPPTLLFVAGAAVPVIAFLFLTGPGAVTASLVSNAVALVLIGAATTLLTGRSVLYSGARQLLIGLGAAAVTFATSRLLGVTLAG